MKKLLVLMFSLALIFIGCGGGGGDGDSSSGGETEETTYNSGGSVGDLLTYTLNMNTLAYSYEIIESEFGLTGQTGSGTLTLDNNGFTYTPSGDPNARVIILPNALVVGGAEVTVSGNTTTMLFAGVPQLTVNYTPSEIEGVYNFITYECNNALVNGVCDSGYYSYIGTFKIDANGTWEACGGSDYPCPQPDSGSWTDLGNGLLEAKDSQGNKVATLMLLPSNAGGKVIIGDLKDRPFEDAGPGLLVGVKRVDISNEDIGGTYYAFDSYGIVSHITVNNAANQYDDYGPCPNGGLSRNDPWDGWLTADNCTPTDTSDDGVVLILPGDGVFIATDRYPSSAGGSGSDFIAVGAKQ